VSGISAPVRRIDAEEKIAGRTRYLADLSFPGLLYARLLRSTRARARIRRIVIPELPEGYRIVDRRDVPGRNRVALIRLDWPAFAEDRVDFIGEVILLLAGPDREELQRLHDAIRVEYEDLPPAFTPEEAERLEGGSIFGPDNLYADYTLVKGDPEAGFARAARVVEEVCRTGFQEHVYLEPQSMVGAWEGGRVVLYGSLQCPYYVHRAAVTILGCPEDGVRVVQTPTGGGFGGKEDYPEIIGAPLAVAAWRIRRPIQLVLDRREDLAFTSKRHPSEIRYRTALDGSGSILATEIDIRLNGGAHESYSAVVLQRALFTSTNVYDIPGVRVRARAYATNVVPSGAFRGFGAPQAIFGMETHLLHIARELGEDPLELKRRHFLKQGSATVTGGAIHEPVMLGEMLRRIEAMSGYREKQRAYGGLGGGSGRSHCGNRRFPLSRIVRGRSPASRFCTGGRRAAGAMQKPQASAKQNREAVLQEGGSRRGVGLSVFLHGCGFTGDGEQTLIKARVRLRRQADGRVEILAANTEIGQGFATTGRKIVAGVLGLPLEAVLYRDPDTDRVPDSGPTVASRSTMVVGYLLQEAARELKDRWAEPGEPAVEKRYAPPPWLRWNQETFQGDAYPAYGWGVNVVEVEVDPVTGEVRVLGTWAVYDVGTAVDRRIVEGQAAGGMVQGLGFAGLERLSLKDGRFEQATLADYPIPTALDFPPLAVDLVDNPYPYGPFGAKGAGELTFDGAAPAFLAAVEQATGCRFSEVPLTPEAILAALAGPDGAADGAAALGS
jgi:CO/xanthine dehydrogenase Mo-binding subunit